MPVSDTKAPSNKSPEFKRDSFLRSPDWRWQEAKKLMLALINKTACVMPDDPLILYTARIQKACLNPETRLYIRVKMPDTWQVFSLGSMDSGSQLKASLLACIVYGLPPKKISLKLKWITPLQAKLYMDLFCDLLGISGISLWFEQMLLEPARQNRSMNLFRARALAHYHSLDLALKSLRFGNMGKPARELLQTMIRDARSGQIFDYMAKNLNIPIDIYVQSMLQAIKGFELHDFILQNKQETVGADSVAAITAGLDNSIRSFTQAEIAQGVKGTLDASAKYIETIIKLKAK